MARFEKLQTEISFNKGSSGLIHKSPFEVEKGIDLTGINNGRFCEKFTGVKSLKSSVEEVLLFSNPVSQVFLENLSIAVKIQVGQNVLPRRNQRRIRNIP